MKAKPFPKKQWDKVVDFYQQGWQDRKEGRPYCPPKYKHGKTAYKNGYYEK